VNLNGPVLVVGTGLIGTSIGLALARRRVVTYLHDADPTIAHIAASRGAGLEAPLPEPPQLVVVATPPQTLGEEVAAGLAAYPDATVTDVGSVKTRPFEELRDRGVAMQRYVGSHPMAGSERSGPLAAAADLFDGRAWAIVERKDCDPSAVSAVRGLIAACGAVAVPMDCYEHDLAVARISHLPHVAAALVAGQLGDAPSEHLALSGSGVRDVTRIAAGDPGLWRQILDGNAEAVTGLLRRLRADIDAMISSLSAGDGAGVEKLLEAGAVGTAAIPAKHGGPSVQLSPVTVTIPDEPGALARLFADAGVAGVNVEDVRIDHDPARAFGLVELDVAAASAAGLVAALTDRGWAAHR
jgi:prephenate dehydrogenase